MKQNNKILIETLNGIELIDIKKIFFFKANGKKTEFNLKDRKIISNKNLGHFEKKILSLNFTRIHHSYIVNIDKIKLIDRKNFTCILNNLERLPIAKRRLRHTIDHILNSQLSNH